MTAGSLWTELRRRGVLGAVATYVVVAAGTLQLADVVSHGLDLPSWTIKAIIWLSVGGLPIVFAVSWFYDLTKKGLVRTELPRDRAQPSPVLVPLAQTPSPLTPSPQPAARVPLDANSLSSASPPLAGRYRIERELGSGGMGRVLAAHDEKLGRRVAIKLLTGAHDTGRLARFSQEARTAGALEHPNVLAVYDLGDHDGSPFLVTELLDGTTLREVIKKGPLDPDAARKIAIQLARGLDAAHARGVIHRDLKPENLFLTRDGRLKILDFGLAKLTGLDGTPSPNTPNLTVTGSIFGTPGYLAPEQAKGHTSDARSDIFAVGAVLYELLSGKRAFPGDSLVEAGHAALTQEPPPILRAPPGLMRAVQKCLQKDPAKRFQNGSELVTALESLDTGTELAKGPKGLTWEQRWRRMPGWFRVGFWTVVALAGLSAIGRLFGGGDDEVKVVRARDRNAHNERPLPALPPVSPGAPAAPPSPPQNFQLSIRPEPAAPAAQAEDEADKQERGADQREALANEKIANAHRITEDALKNVRIPNIPGIDAKALEAQIRKAARVGQEDADETRDVADRGSLVGTMQGAHALFQAAKYGQAESILRRQIERQPNNVYLQLYLFAVQRRQHAGPQAEAALRAFIKELDDDDWPEPIAELYLGDMSEEKLLSEAEDEDDVTKRESRICEASFYAGLFYESATPPDLERAKHFLTRAASSTATDLEGSFAAQDLQRIEHPMPDPHPQNTPHDKQK